MGHRPEFPDRSQDPSDRKNEQEIDHARFERSHSTILDNRVRHPGLMNARLRLHDFWFQASDEGYDFTALGLGYCKRVEARSKTAHESRVVGLCNAHPFM